MKDDLSKTSFFRFLPHVIIIVIGAGFSFSLFFAIRYREKLHLEHEFRRVAENRVSALERLIQSKFSIIESVRCFFESSEFVEREEFRSFTSSFSGFEGIFAIEWVPRVKDNERDEFETRSRLAELPDFFMKEKNSRGDFVSAQKREEYFPVFYVEPFTENQGVLGFDYASEPLRYQALIAARDGNLSVATETIRLVQEQWDTNSFLVFVPLYKKDMSVNTVQERRENLEGFIVGAFHIHTLVERAMSFTDVQNISIYLSDISAANNKKYLHYRATQDFNSNGITDDISVVKTSSAMYMETIINVGTRQWSVICTPEEGLIDLYTTGNSWAMLAIGLLLTSSAYLYFLFSWRKTESIQRLIEIRTEELRHELHHRIQTERKLAQIAKRLEAKNDELEHVVYIASHDLRSPLVTISGFDSELQKSCDELKNLVDGEPLDEQKMSVMNSLLEESIPESLKFIHAGVEKAQMLIDGLLQVSRIGSSPFKIEPMDMNELMENVVDSHRFQAKECGATITVETLPNCMGDVAKTNQVFSNLITNALKYLSPERPGKIAINGYLDDARSIYCIEDNGIGIPLAHQSRIFQIFHRACSDTAVKGEGLGLAIVTRILEGQKGEIWLESEVDKGSKFYVSLPKV
ncbi:MAG: CHASE domain-containing protein [Phycisphaerae bacterium]|nr:CHASE domain-containing protein [Phycisphaerae bacterium]